MLAREKGFEGFSIIFFYIYMYIFIFYIYLIFEL